ncbi:MAG TPA: DsbA family oxidoreductase [Tenuifilaceae bacterium]|nr:DsbA family oxidoreductase [Tenuifilaceae bacterium]
MKVEVWSDVACPFCYIGKVRLEKALSELGFANEIQVIWKSFMLNPNLVTDLNLSITDYLINTKDLLPEEVEEMNQYITEMALKSGLELNIEKIVVANTRKAHNLIHYAKSKGKQSEMKSRIFKAYFTESRNVDDIDELVLMAKEVGLETENLKEIISNEVFNNDIETEIYESRQIGVRGVPHFVIDNKIVINGAQEQKVFSQTIEKAYADWKQANGDKTNTTINGLQCDIDGKCNN